MNTIVLQIGSERIEVDLLNYSTAFTKCIWSKKIQEPKYFSF